VLAGTMLGEVGRDRLVVATGARPGDVVVLTKRPAVEATAILARERADALAPHVDPATLARAAAFLHEPGISVVREARAALAAGEVHAMHDVTEGGLATGLQELAAAAGLGVEVDAAAVVPYPETLAVCAPFGIDPWGAIGSGSLLLAVSAADADAVVRAITEAGVEARAIGVLVATRACTVSGRPLPRFARDEIVKAFS
jgi:hydrogenase expression/formation protein HypE